MIPGISSLQVLYYSWGAVLADEWGSNCLLRYRSVLHCLENSDGCKGSGSRMVTVGEASTLRSCSRQIYCSLLETEGGVWVLDTCTSCLHYFAPYLILVQNNSKESITRYYSILLDITVLIIFSRRDTLSVRQDRKRCSNWVVTGRSLLGPHDRTMEQHHQLFVTQTPRLLSAVSFQSGNQSIVSTHREWCSTVAFSLGRHRRSKERRPQPLVSACSYVLQSSALLLTNRRPCCELLLLIPCPSRFPTTCVLLLALPGSSIRTTSELSGVLIRGWFKQTPLLEEGFLYIFLPRTVQAVLFEGRIVSKNIRPTMMMVWWWWLMVIDGHFLICDDDVMMWWCDLMMFVLMIEGHSSPSTVSAANMSVPYWYTSSFSIVRRQFLYQAS